MPALARLEAGVKQRPADPEFQAELGRELEQWVGRPDAADAGARPVGALGRGRIPEARRHGAHRRAQDQQRDRPGAAGEGVWAPNASSPRPAPASTGWRPPPHARAKSASRASSTWAPSTSSARRPTWTACSSWAPKSCPVDERRPDAAGGDRRGLPRLGLRPGGHLLPAGLGGRSAPLSVSGARAADA